MDSDLLARYTHGVPVKMSPEGLETLLKVWLSQTGTPPEILQKFFIDSTEELGVKVVNTVLATTMKSFVDSENDSNG